MEYKPNGIECKKSIEMLQGNQSMIIRTYEDTKYSGSKLLPTYSDCEDVLCSRTINCYTVEQLPDDIPYESMLECCNVFFKKTGSIPKGLGVNPFAKIELSLPISGTIINKDECSSNYNPLHCFVNGQNVSHVFDHFSDSSTSRIEEATNLILDPNFVDENMPYDSTLKLQELHAHLQECEQVVAGIKVEDQTSTSAATLEG